MLYMRVLFPGTCFEIFDPPEARYPSRGQRTCFFEIFDPPEARYPSGGQRLFFGSTDFRGCPTSRSKQAFGNTSTRLQYFHPMTRLLSED